MEKKLSTSPPRRRVHSEVLRTSEERLERLRQELSDVRHAEESQEARWQLEERAKRQESQRKDQSSSKAELSIGFCLNMFKRSLVVLARISLRYLHCLQDVLIKHIERCSAELVGLQ